MRRVTQGIRGGSRGGSLHLPFRHRTHLPHHPADVIVHGAFDRVSLDDLRVPPAQRDPKDSAPIFVAQSRIGHAVHQQPEDRDGAEQQPGIEPEPAYRMTTQIRGAGASDLQPRIEVEGVEAAEKGLPGRSGRASA